MILSAEIVAQIKRHQRTMIRVPIKDTVVPIFTADPNRLCPFKPGRAYKVKTKQHAPPACEITIESVKGAIFENEPIWEIRFKLGNHTDEDRYPAARAGGAGGDYTSVPSRKLNGTGAEVSAHELSRFVAMRNEKEPDRLAEQKRRLDAALTEIRKHGRNPFVNKQLREARERIRTIRVPKRYDPLSASEQTSGDARGAQSGAGT